MYRYVLRRLVQSVFLLLGISAMVFFIMRIAPGGPAAFTGDPKLGKTYRDQQIKEFGLDQPLPVQYGKWLWQALHGNFGRSYTDKRPVMTIIAERTPRTLLLSGLSLIFGLFGIVLGTLAALRRGGAYDNSLRVFTVIGNAVPHWWLGLILLLVSARTIKIFPLAPPLNGSVGQWAQFLMLPTALGALGGWLGFSRFMRAELLDIISQDFIRTARAKGLPEAIVTFRHAVRNALIPIVTILGGTLAGLFSGSVLFENVFSYPGLGKLAVEAAFQRDLPVTMALVMISAALVIVGQLISDIAYGFVDPRVKLQ
jgi:peptide/nickel transport system permease protein